MQEEWKSVPGYEGIYEISNTGRVRRLPRVINHGQSRSKMTSRLGNTPRSDAPVERYLAEHELKISINNGYRVAYLCPKDRQVRILYIDKTIKSLFGASHNFEPDQETWKPVVAYENLYEVSDTGLVRSLGKTASDGRYIRPRTITIGFGTSGYPKCMLIKDGECKTFMIHRLVAQAFIPNPLGLDCVHHKDEDKTNCRANNLEWTTRADNVRDWFKRRDGDAVKRVAAALGISEAEARKIILGDSNHS